MNVSVIIPTYNGSDTIEKAIKSVYSQTVKPTEIIVVDDCSSEDIYKIIKKIDKKEIPIIIERFTKRRGACAARNRGAQLAENEVLMFLDDDDTWEANKVERQLEIFNNNPSIEFVYSGRLVVSDNNRSNVLYKILPKHRGYLYPQIFYRNFIGTTSSVAIKKSLFQKVGGFDPLFPALQDYDLWIRCSKETFIEHDNSCNVRYTVSENQNKQISGNSENHVKAIKQLIKKYKSEIKKLGILKSRKIYSSFYFYVAKAKRRNGILQALKWILLSNLLYPNIRTLALLTPDFILNKLRKLK